MLQNCGYLVVLSWLWPLVAPEELELDGELELGWLLVEPAPAAPLLEDGELEELGLDDAPPPAFFSSVDEEAAPELELGEVLDWPELEEDEAAPEGEDGVVLDGEDVEPEDDAAPEPPVVRPAEPVVLSPQAATPKARVTAAARIDSFMCIRLRGWGIEGWSKLRTRTGCQSPLFLLRASCCGLEWSLASPGSGFASDAVPDGDGSLSGEVVLPEAAPVVGCGGFAEVRGRGGSSPHAATTRERAANAAGIRVLMRIAVSLLVAGYLYLQGIGREDLSPAGHGDIAF